MNSQIKNSFSFMMIVAFILIINIGCDEYSVGPNDNVNSTSYIAKQSFNISVFADNNSKFRLEAINGNITITGSSSTDSIIVNGERSVGSESMEDAESHLKLLSVNMHDITSGKLIKTTQPKESNGRSYIVNYIVTVPKHFEIFVELVNGNVSINSIDNTVTANNVNGEIVLTNINGSTFANIVNGQIKSRQSLPLNGTIDLGSVNGNIVLDIPTNTSAQFSASSVNGNISTSNLVFQNQIITTNSLSGKLNNGEGNIDLSIVNGGISVSGY